MRYLGVAAIALALTSTAASAQFEPLAFAICKKIAADTARLKCFDEIGASQPNTEKETPTAAAKWEIEEDKSPIDDSLQITATIKGTPTGAGLLLRCKEHKTEAAFVPAGFFIGGMGDRVPVLARLNEEKPINASWLKSSNGQATFAPNAIEFIKLLPDNGKLFLRATGFQGRQFDGLFQLADVTAVRAKIEETCHWSTPKADKAAATKR
jgi:type VI secretion system protein VasI